MTSRFLLPSLNSSSRYCSDWNPEERPSVLRNEEYSNGVSVDSTLQAPSSSSCSREMRASILNDGSRLSRRTHSNTCDELVQEQPHPQLRHLVDDDEQHLVLLDGVRLLRVEQLVELQVFAIGLRGAQVPVHAFVLQIDSLLSPIVSSNFSEKTQRGTWRQPCTSSRSSARQSAQCRSTACQKRAE